MTREALITCDICWGEIERRPTLHEAVQRMRVFRTGKRIDGQDICDDCRRKNAGDG